ncbi:MAG: hypothetical protein RR550_00825, partial [Rikenellaceae bacterium]
WNIIPDKHIVAQFGDIEGLTIGGVTMHGNGSFLNNIYMTGTNIQFTPEQLEDMKGNDAYSVCLTSQNATIKKRADGTITYHGEVNVVSGESTIVSGDLNVVATNHLLSTHIQALKGAKPMFYSDIMQPYAYTVETYPVNCQCIVDGGVLLVTSITDLSKESAYVDLDINCEGNAVISLRYSVTIVVDGATGEDGKDGKGIEFIFKRQSTATAPTTPQSVNIDDNVPTGWTDDQQGVDATYQYEFACKRVKVNGTWGNFSTPALWAKYSFDGATGENGKWMQTKYLFSDDKPATPDNDSIVNWIDVPDQPLQTNIKYEHIETKENATTVLKNWKIVDGWFTSPANMGHNGYARAKIMVTTLSDN